MKMEYKHKRFSDGSIEIINAANDIIAEYSDEGLELTLRQLYYQFVSRDLMENKQSEYKRLGSIISDARLAGAIDWYAIEDRTRNLRTSYHNTDPGQAVQDALDQFLLNKWLDQPYRPEVWIEKEALLGVISGVCRRLDVPYFACKGYVSQSEMWRAGMRMKSYKDNGQTPIIIHLGDHDPSGIDMTRDIFDKHSMFMGGIEVKRIALTYEQIQKYDPPPNVAKLSDSRSKGYVEKFGSSSWELDALSPKVLSDLITKTIEEITDRHLLILTQEREYKYKDVMRNISENWDRF